MALPIRQLNSQVSYLADGVTTVWDLSLSGGYIDKAHVFAEKFHIATGVITDLPLSGGSWIGDYQLSITPPVPVGYEVTLYRNTPKDIPLVNFADKANLTEAALDLNARQAIFVAAESSDQLAVSIDAIANIVNYVDVAAASAAAAQASQTAAANSATAAAGSATASATSASQSATSATASGNSATASATSATQAQGYASAASGSATAAGSSAGSASGSASAAATSATNSANSATAAATSATNASNSATAASGSASTASTQATNASNSATAASGSASAASTSATNAANSASAAAASAASIAGGPVASFNTRTGAVTLTKADVTGTGLAKADIALGNVANIAQVERGTGIGQLAGNIVKLGYDGSGGLKATVDSTDFGIIAFTGSPALIGNPTATTQAVSDNSTRIANTSWVRSAMSNIASAAGCVLVAGTTGYFKFPNYLGGWIIQWGTTVATTNASSALSITYPIAFSSGVWTALVGNGDSGAQLGSPLISSGGMGGSSMTVVWSNGSGGVGNGISVRTNWIVLGN